MGDFNRCIERILAEGSGLSHRRRDPMTNRLGKEICSGHLAGRPASQPTAVTDADKEKAR